MKMNGGQILGATLVLGALGLIGWQATKESSSVTFYTPAEIYATPDKFVGKTFRVAGLVLSGTKNWDADSRNLKFRMTDLNGHEFSVNYNGIPPDLFKEGQGVVIEGKIASNNLKENNTLNASLLMVKHSEEYDTKQDHSKLKEAKLLDSILMNQKVEKRAENDPAAGKSVY
jgi:cytochrome c-type biogenesis protein CcmE